MRILHTSDWHVGRTLHGANLQSAHAQFFDWLVGVVERESVDALIIAGDVFDRAVPPLEAVELVDRVVSRLAELTTVVFTPGNHDSALRLGFGQDWNEERVIVRSRAAEVGEPIVLRGRDGSAGAVLFALPYLDPELARGQLAQALADREVARSHEGVVAAAMELVKAGHAQVDQELPVVVVAHAFVAGGRASDSERDIKVGGVDLVPSEVIVPPAGWRPNYVALGHLHRAQNVGGLDGAQGGPVMRYSGSPVAFSFSEAGDEKSVTLVELTRRGGGAKTTVLAAPVERPLAVLRGSMEELLSEGHATYRSHYVSVEVTDAVRPAEMVARIKAVFPWALVTQHKPEVASQQSEIDAASRRSTAARANPVDVVGDFLTAVTGQEVNAELLAEIAAGYESVRAAKEGAK
ncbi:MAG: exonuclease SbcCD subunit D C-terminal domain-containing protein [Buchananella hordeovulneris]|nr:exonuclease SbcCD subunit D C-terminal domain-containing protein [Buchananella hordeovulneris]